MKIKVYENVGDMNRHTTSMQVTFYHNGRYSEKDIEDAITRALEKSAKVGRIIPEYYTDFEGLGSPADWGLDSDYPYITAATRDFHSDGDYKSTMIYNALEKEFRYIDNVEYDGCSFEEIDYYEDERNYDYLDEI